MNTRFLLRLGIMLFLVLPLLELTVIVAFRGIRHKLGRATPAARENRFVCCNRSGVRIGCEQRRPE